ncbi:MAG TPA: universal stress protein [Candidatus Limnocylindrales bacterium]|nr:universal stress protein [Candidatus Limnocylindrales bacterium]
MREELRRKTPDDLLREIEAAEPLRKKGYLKIFLGYASGVGKSFRMLDEARRRRERGQDVIVGAMQPRVRAEAESLLRKLEVIPLMQVERGTAIDVDAISRRQPAVCFIDGLAYDNPPGSRNPTRWQDVRELLNAGMKVVASINIQYVAECREEVERITGKHVEETVPVAFIKSADEIEIVDAPPEEPIERTPQEEVDARWRAQRLSKLRELALVLAADVVDHQLQEYLEQHGIRQQVNAHERILVCITPRANVQEMIEAARTTAERFHAEFIVAYVRQAAISESDQAALNERLEVARAAGARIEILEGDDAVAAILDFAASTGITQLFIGHSQRSGIGSRLWGNPVDKLIQRSRGMDVRVFPQ